MERSSPLAALQPPCMQPQWARPDANEYDANFLRPNALDAARSFNFKDLSMHRRRKSNNDYFAWKPIRGSSPSASLAADLSQNFHIDQTPQAATPRRSLFANISVHNINDPENIVTPPIPSSPGLDSDPMDCSPLPHKPPFQAKIEHISLTGLPTPDPTPEMEQDGFSQPELLSVGPALMEPPQLSPPRQRKPSATRPFLKKGFSSNILARPRSAEASNPSFIFGSNFSSLASQPLLESCAESPPSAQKSSSPMSDQGTPLGALPRLNLTCNNGSPVGGIQRRPSRPRAGLSRRTQSLQYNRPVMPMRSEKRFCTEGAISATMDLEPVSSLKLPHFRPDHEPDALPRITKDTLVDVLSGKYISEAGSATIIDCRFEYEYDGGHIDGAVNFNDKEALKRQLFQDTPFAGSRTLIFHCEYSAHRAPLMAKAIREEDRMINQDNYPHLTYPEVYILDGGYSHFFEGHQALCFPQSYKRMDASEHAEDCERGMARVKRRNKLSRAQTYAFGQGKQSDPVSAPALFCNTTMADRMELDFEQAMQCQSAFPDAPPRMLSRLETI